MTQVQNSSSETQWIISLNLSYHIYFVENYIHVVVVVVDTFVQQSFFKCQLISKLYLSLTHVFLLIL